MTDTADANAEIARLKREVSELSGLALATGVILAALYLLWAYQRVFHGEPDDQNKGFTELTFREAGVLLPMVAAIIFCGVYPKPMLDRIEKVVALEEAQKVAA